jgi:Plasmid pRiA4b ORF-3-like protein
MRFRNTKSARNFQSRRKLGLCMRKEYSLRKLRPRTKPAKIAKKGSKTPLKRGSAGPQDVVFKVTLVGTKPLIWRRLRLSSAMTLADLHYAIQGAFDWEDRHLHEFTLGDNERYSIDPQSDEDPIDEETPVGESYSVTLGALISRRIKKLSYEYDFGDSWQHEIKIEKIGALSGRLFPPECIGGKQKAPPEDCGGVWGFQDFLADMTDTKSTENEARKEWFGGTFDPEDFDLSSANAAIRGFFKRARNRSK